MINARTFRRFGIGRKEFNTVPDHHASTHVDIGDTIAPAVEAARIAAQHAGVTVRDLDGMVEHVAMIALFDEIWRSPVPLMSLEHTRAMGHTGNFLAGAFEGSDLIGACTGFFSAPPGDNLHSHIAGVHPATRGRSVGFAVKLYQRAWALQRGLTTITWTFDPLIRRNAYVNLVKLGALPQEYLIDFYGEIDDAVNAGQGSDRLFLKWNLTAETTEACCAGKRLTVSSQVLDDPGLVIALKELANGEIYVAPAAVRDVAPVLLVQPPADIESLRKTDPELAKQWRMAVREVLGGPLAEGAYVSGMTDTGYYVVQR
jgi:predicted GNAT superfamily acetyltransferase